MRFRLGTIIVLAVLGAGCFENEARFLELRAKINQANSELEKTRAALANQAEEKEQLIRLKSKVQAFAANLDMPLTTEEPELFAEHVNSEVKTLAGNGLKVTITSLDRGLDERGYAKERSVLSLQGKPEEVMSFLRRLAQCRIGRLCRLVSLEIDRSPEQWSGTVTVDFYLRGYTKGIGPFFSPQEVEKGNELHEGSVQSVESENR